MKDEVKRILKMIEEGKITSEEGFKLLNALEEVSFTQPRGKFLKIYIKDEEDIINITLPVNLFKFIMNLLPAKAKMTLQENEVNLSEILNAIQEGANGTLVEITGERWRNYKNFMWNNKEAVHDKWWSSFNYNRSHNMAKQNGYLAMVLGKGLACYPRNNRNNQHNRKLRIKRKVCNLL